MDLFAGQKDVLCYFKDDMIPVSLHLGLIKSVRFKECHTDGPGIP